MVGHSHTLLRHKCSSFCDSNSQSSSFLRALQDGRANWRFHWGQGCWWTSSGARGTWTECMPPFPSFCLRLGRLFCSWRKAQIHADAALFVYEGRPVLLACICLFTHVQSECALSLETYPSWSERWQMYLVWFVSYPHFSGCFMGSWQGPLDERLRKFLFHSSLHKVSSVSSSSCPNSWRYSSHFWHIVSAHRVRNLPKTHDRPCRNGVLANQAWRCGKVLWKVSWRNLSMFWPISIPAPCWLLDVASLGWKTVDGFVSPVPIPVETVTPNYVQTHLKNLTQFATYVETQ